MGNMKNGGGEMMYPIEADFYTERMERQTLAAKQAQQRDILPDEACQEKRRNTGRKILCSWKKAWQGLRRRFALT